QRQPIDILVAQFSAECRVIWDRPQYNIAPGHGVLALRQLDVRTLDLLYWGLIPFRAKSAKVATAFAPADAVATKSTFRPAFKKRRCLVVADGYFEWLRKGKHTTPFFYEVDHGKPFAIAGLWQPWNNLETCCIITTEANHLAAEIHDSMPVILDAPDYSAWL